MIKKDILYKNDSVVMILNRRYDIVNVYHHFKPKISGPRNELTVIGDLSMDVDNLAS